MLRLILALALLLLPAVAEAQARQISALSVTQIVGSWPPVFWLNTLDGPPDRVIVRDQATGAILGFNRGLEDCTLENDCPEPGVLYGPHEIPPEPATAFRPAEPRFWATWGWLEGNVRDGQGITVKINGRRPLVLTCVETAIPGGGSYIVCD